MTTVLSGQLLRVLVAVSEEQTVNLAGVLRVAHEDDAHAFWIVFFTHIGCDLHVIVLIVEFPILPFTSPLLLLISRFFIVLSCGRLRIGYQSHCVVLQFLEKFDLGPIVADFPAILLK